jgi:hypothetical protein
MHDEPTQAEKRAVHENDRSVREPTTYSALAEISDPAPGGRFAVDARKPANAVPRQPANSPWHADPTGVEPPLGYAIDDQEPTGTAAEIAASRAALGASGEPATVVAPEDVLSAPGAPPRIRRRV